MSALPPRPPNFPNCHHHSTLAMNLADTSQRRVLLKKPHICKCIPQSRGRAHQRAGTERKRREPAQRAAAQKHCRRARPAKQRKAAPTKRQARVRKAKQVKRNAAESGTGGTKVAPGGLSHAPAALLFRHIHLQLDTRCSLQGHPSSLVQALVASVSQSAGIAAS